MGLLHALSDWLVGLADSGWAVALLAGASFAEAIVFPVPPDPLLTAIALLRPESALWLAGVATGASVAGAIVGHWLGMRYGRPLLERVAPADKVLAVERLFNRYGWWAIVVAAFTPLPFKLFVITAGVLRLDRRRFIVASIVGRGARFFLLGALILIYGESVQQFLENNFELVTIAATAALLLAAAALAAGLYAHRRRRHRHRARAKDDVRDDARDDMRDDARDDVRDDVGG